MSTPIASRRHVAIFGAANAGKSALFNRLLGQELALVSEVAGTTTDPVIKAMELLPFGPIALIDTAGLGDDSALGSRRMEKTAGILDRADFALVVADASEPVKDCGFTALLEKRGIGYIQVFTKGDLISPEEIKRIKNDYPVAYVLSPDSSLDALKAELAAKLSAMEQDEGEDTQIGGLLPPGSKAVMVVPLDSESPKGRLILPQVQFIRYCLDHGVTCVSTTPDRLAEVLAEQHEVSLVVTDSQVFAQTARDTPEDIPLTSFSMLLANKTGRMELLIEGAEAISGLKDGDTVLMAEACTHNHTHEDIGRVKIPNALKKATGKALQFEYAVAHDFPRELDKYALVVHCGSCMINKRTTQNRLDRCREQGVPVTNYGVLLAKVSGILERAARAIQGKSEA